MNIVFRPFVIGATLLFAGCANIDTYDIEPIQDIQYTHEEKIRLSVALVLTDKYCDYTYKFRETGDMYSVTQIHLGPHLCQQAKLLADKLFLNVDVYNSGTQVRPDQYDAVLKPGFPSVRNPIGGFAWGDRTFEIETIWKLHSPKGVNVWVEKITGTGVEVTGTLFGVDGRTKTRVHKALLDLSEQTGNAIAGSEDISRYEKNPRQYEEEVVNKLAEGQKRVKEQQLEIQKKMKELQIEDGKIWVAQNYHTGKTIMLYKGMTSQQVREEGALLSVDAKKIELSGNTSKLTFHDAVIGAVYVINNDVLEDVRIDSGIQMPRFIWQWSVNNI